MISLLLAGVLPLTGASEPADGVFLQRQDPATGKPVLVPLGWGDPDFGSPEPGVKRLAKPKGKWVEIVEIRPPRSDTSPKTTTIRNLPAQGPAREPLHPAEGIFLVRRGANVASPRPSWTPADHLEVLHPGTQVWLVVGTEYLALGEYHMDGTGLSAGGEISIKIEGGQVQERVTYQGSYRSPDGGGGYFQEETIESYPLAALGDESIGSGFGAIRVRKVRR